MPGSSALSSARLEKRLAHLRRQDPTFSDASAQFVHFVDVERPLTASEHTVLAELLVDRRGGRLGFPTVIVRELQLLQAFNQRHRIEDRPERLWERVARLAGRG